jgi:hypothetical protein
MPQKHVMLNLSQLIRQGIYPDYHFLDIVTLSDKLRSRGHVALLSLGYYLVKQPSKYKGGVTDLAIGKTGISQSNDPPDRSALLIEGTAVGDLHVRKSSAGDSHFTRTYFDLKIINRLFGQSTGSLQ